MPYPPTDGGSIAVFEPLKRLSERGHKITLLAFCQSMPSDDVLNSLRQYCIPQFVTHDTKNRFIPAMINLFFSSLPYTISKYTCGLFSRRMRNILEKGQYDIVQLEHLHMASYHRISQDEFHIPTVLRQHNLESLLSERYSNSQKGLVKLYTSVHAAKLKAYETKVCKHMDLCLTITQEDAERLQGLDKKIKTLVVPAGVDTDFYAPDYALEEVTALVSAGSMDWPPNSDALLWFYREIFPHIRKTLPQVQLHIVGKNPPKDIQRLAQDASVFVTGFVKDVRMYYAKGSVFIVPLRSGGGMRLKILEAMAMGRAVVSTTIGAEGIQVTHGKDILLADDPAGFADCVCRLLGNPDLRRFLGDNARNLVRSQYTWEASVDLLEKAYETVVQV